MVKDTEYGFLTEVVSIFNQDYRNASRLFIKNLTKGVDFKNKIDKGIYSIYFFNIVNLSIGEAIFQDAGVPHAYLEVQNMELMANSDNVLRGGLTPKYVDVPELMKHVTFNETVPHIILGEVQKDGLEKIYPSPAQDFELSKIQITSNDVYKKCTNTAEILFVLEGNTTITEGDTILVCNKGEAVFLAAQSNYQITTSSVAIIYKAITPNLFCPVRDCQEIKYSELTMLFFSFSRQKIF
jgi:mannose-6-phosphate isomerase